MISTQVILGSIGKALGNYVSNLAHIYSFIIFAKIVHIWIIVTVSAEIWVKGHPVTFREVENEFSRSGQTGACYLYLPESQKPDGHGQFFMINHLMDLLSIRQTCFIVQISET